MTHIFGDKSPREMDVSLVPLDQIMNIIVYIKLPKSVSERQAKFAHISVQHSQEEKTDKC